MIFFTRLYRFSWLLLVFLLIFFNRQNIYWVIFTLFILFFVSSIAILRALESRKQWRSYIKEENLDDTVPK
ncbi:MAG: hypothetical protein VX820_02205 [Candidatus Neomarinimicrobiota bacterium]|nr:hypothetical protein [Candidatus Neomarinimicrobiota bacterium]